MSGPVCKTGYGATILATMNRAGGSGALAVLLVMATTVGLASCGSSASTNGATAYASCLHKEFDPSSIAARVACQSEAQRSCPKGVTFYPRFGCGLPRSVRVKFLNVTRKFLPGWIACVARNGYRLPTPNTSGGGTVFPTAIQRNSKYRAAAKHCVSIERREIQALTLAARS